MKKIIKKIIDLINKLLKNKKLFYYSPNENNILGKTAVKTKFNFWYVGDVLDQKDIACGILNNGIIEPNETNLILKIFEYLKTKEFVEFLDIGANTGYYGLLAAKFFNNNIKIHSFEPVKEFATCIEESIKINNFIDKIKVYNIGLSNIDGEKEIYVSGTCSSLEKDFNKKISIRQKIKLKRLDDIKIMPDIIKIDVEGHELMTLKGGLETLKKYQPIIFMELINRLDSHNFINKNYSETIKILKDIGYTPYLFKDNVLTEFKNNLNIEGIYMYLFLNKKHKDLFDTLSI